jgi:type III restriction enzyme
VLQEALADPAAIGWLRIEDRKECALTIPYQSGSDTQPLCPDFLVFREVGERVVVDILDPHDAGRDDWLPKIKGMAQYGSKHWQSFGKIEASFVEKSVIRRLDLRIEKNRTAALKADGTNGLRALFS